MTATVPAIPTYDFRASIGSEGYVQAERSLALDKVRPMVEDALRSALEHRALPEPIKRAAEKPAFLELCLDSFQRIFQLADYQSSKEPLADRVVQSALYQLAAGTDATMAWNAGDLQRSLTAEGRHLVAVGARCGCANEKVIPALYGITSGGQAALQGHKLTIVMPFECTPKPLAVFDAVLSQLSPGTSVFHADGRPDVPVIAKLTTSKAGELNVNGLIRHKSIHGSENPAAATEHHIRTLIGSESYWPDPAVSA